MTTRPLARRAAVALLALGAATACNDFLSAENPGAIDERDLTGLAYVQLLTNGAVGTFQAAVSDLTYWNAQFTDELYNRAVFAEEGQIDRRELFSEMTYINAFIYAPMQRARYQGEDAARRLKEILADSASRDIRVARSLAYAGHAYVALGEAMCTVPIDRGAPKTPEEIFADAITRFDEAVTVATAARVAARTRADTLAADSVRNFALVGAGRAALNRNERPRAIAYASQVPATFDFRAYYTDNTPAQRSRAFISFGLTPTSPAATMLNTPFAAKTGDPRIPRFTGTTPAARASAPLAPSAYSSWNNTVAGADFTPVMSVRIASGLEAQYIVAEAQGPTAATLTFVNQRRAAGQQAPVALAGDALMAELREQRSRDLYLDNHRLGDLRRYKKYYNVDLFPTGPYPGSTTGAVYGTSECWPLPVNEINDNPNIPKS